MKFNVLLFLGLSLFSYQLSYAIQVTDVYETTIPVKDETATNRKSATATAFVRVLIKLTGDQNIAQREEVRGLLEQPGRFVQQFRYQQIQETDAQGNLTTETDKVLWVEFDETTLNEALKNQGITVWGKERPSVLVWLGYEEDSTRHFVSLQDGSEYQSILHQSARARGVPLLLPLLDLEDISQITVSDVWAGFEEPILNASNRYEADIILSGKLIQVAVNDWQSQWTIYSDAKVSWTSLGETPELALVAGLNELADRLAREYRSTIKTDTQALELMVTDIKTVDYYAETLAYLQSIQVITGVQVKQVKKNEVLFEVISHGGSRAINKTIALGRRLEKHDDTEQLNYRLIK